MAPGPWAAGEARRTLSVSIGYTGLVIGEDDEGPNEPDEPDEDDAFEASDTTTVAGHLLCAVPQLIDPNFHRSVVLMLQHEPDGSLGLVLNNPMPTTVQDVTKSLDLEWVGSPDKLVRLGGPVQPVRGWIFHDREGWDSEAAEIAPGLNLTTSLENIVGSPAAKFGDAGRYMFLLGYAGWDSGQLEAEIASGSWVLVPIRGLTDPEVGVTIDWIFDADPDDMWREALASIGVDPSRLVGMQGSGHVLQ
jgi:putative transcriptional regulator